MSVKFLLIGDRHNSEHIPSSRKDDFLNTCSLKDEEIIKIAKENNVAAILQPGDFWTDADHKLKNEFIADVATKWNNIFNEEGKRIPLIGIVGNHDLIGENLLSFSNSTSGLLDSLNIFRIVSKNKPFIIKDGNNEIVITGTNYHKGMDKPEFINDYIIDEKQGDVHIHIVHGMLTPKDMGKLIRHTKIDNIISTKADVTFCGHDHIGFGILEYDNKLFINPGAVVRLTNDLKEVKREVGVVLLTINDDKTITTEFINLNSALPGEEVLDRSITELKKENSKYIEILKEQVESMGLDKGLEMSDIIDNICDEDKIENIIKTQIKADVESKNISKKARPVAPKDTNIVKLELINFQSHENSVFEFSDNFNVLVGESRQGKSSALRAIRWVLENKPSGKSFVRIGATDCSVSITLKNGTIIERFIKGKDNGYKIYLPDGTVEEGNTKMVSRVQEVCGFNYLDVDKSTSIPLNFLRQGDSWYLIGDGYSATDRARILGSMKDTTAADLVIQDYEKQNKEITTSIKSINVDLANSKLELEEIKKEIEIKEKIKEVVEKFILIEKINQYLELCNDLKEKTNILNEINDKLDLTLLNSYMLNIDKKIEVLNNVNRHINTIHQETNNVEIQNKIINSLSDMKEQTELFEKLRDKIKDFEKCISLMSIIEKESKNVIVQDNIISRISNIDDKKSEKLKEKINNYEMIYNHLLSIHKNTKTIIAANKYIAACSKIDGHEKIEKSILENIEKIKKIKEYNDLYVKNKNQSIENNKKVQIANDEYDKRVQEHVDILVKYGICPTCYAEINREQAEEISNKIKGE